MPALAPASKPLYYDKVKSYFEELQQQKISDLKNNLEKLQNDLYSSDNDINSCKAVLTRQTDYYQDLNRELFKLKQFQNEHNTLLSAECINKLYHPDTLKLYDVIGFDRKTNDYAPNKVYMVLSNINELRLKFITPHTSEQEKQMQELIDIVCAKAIELTVEIINQQQMRHQKDNGQLLSQRLFDKLAYALHVMTNCVGEPQIANQYQHVFASITDMEKTIEPSLIKFARLRPALASFLGFLTMLAGTALFFGGLILATVSPVVAIAMALPGLSIMAAGIIAFMAPCLMKNDTAKAVKSNKTLGEQNEITAASMRSLISGLSTLFAKPKKMPVTTANTETLSSTRQAFLTA